MKTKQICKGQFVHYSVNKFGVVFITTDKRFKFKPFRRNLED